MIVAYYSYLGLACTMLYTKNEYDLLATTLSVQFLIVILAFIKICSLLRIFESYCFLVKMLLGVFWDLRHFLIFFLFVITGFTMMA
jgi:hypothetical protein